MLGVIIPAAGKYPYCSELPTQKGLLAQRKVAVPSSQYLSVSLGLLLALGELHTEQMCILRSTLSSLPVCVHKDQRATVGL